MIKPPQTISESLQALSGQQAWGLNRTHGSMFVLELGRKVDHGRTSRGEPRIHGEWCFLFELCSWSFSNALGVDTISSDLQETIDSKFQSLSLGFVRSANFSEETNQLDIQFTTDLLLSVTPDDVADPEDNEWIFFIPGDLAWAKTRAALTLGSIHAPKS